jgi:hypothetical protein
MRYEVQSVSPSRFSVVDKRHPLLKPVLQTTRRTEALGFAVRMSFRSAWGW